MTSPVPDTTHTRRPWFALRIGVAIALLLAVAAVSESVMWQRYFGRPIAAPAPQEPELEAESALVEVDLRQSEPASAANASLSESRLDQVPNKQAQPLALSHTPESKSVCPLTMVLVAGPHCPTLVHQCQVYLSVERDRCMEYVPNSRCIGKEAPMRFCIDEFEFPNREGEKPTLGLNFLEAAERCKTENKRLCTSREWELACEGDGRLPYPYGYTRDKTSCNIDRPYIIPDNDAYADPDQRDAEIARLDQREPSGARPGCVSSYGVHDMTGNVDEWVLNEQGLVNKPPYRSGLKGGYWGPVRNRCRPMTVDHNEWHTGYQVGFRCCAEALPEVIPNR